MSDLENILCRLEKLIYAGKLKAKDYISAIYYTYPCYRKLSNTKQMLASWQIRDEIIRKRDNDCLAEFFMAIFC